VAADAELTAMRALADLTMGSPVGAESYLAKADRYLTEAEEGLDDGARPVPAERRGLLKVFVSLGRLRLAGERVDPGAVAKEADRLLVLCETSVAGPSGLDAGLRALAMVNLGIAETWAGRLADADRHLEQAAALARRFGQPYVEFSSLANRLRAATFQSLTLAERRSRHVVELAERHGWGEDQLAALGYTMLGAALTGQGRLAEAEPWLDRAWKTLRAEARASNEINLRYASGLLELARGRPGEALTDLLAVDRLAGALVMPTTLTRPAHALALLAQLELGETDRAEATLAVLNEEERQSTQLRVAQAALRIAQRDPQAALGALAPVLDGSVTGTGVQQSWMVEALLLESIALDALGDPDAAWHALERALVAAEPDRTLVSFLLHPVPELLERHARQATAHAALIADILGLLQGENGRQATRPLAHERPGDAPAAARLLEPLSQAETRVLRYLPTSLSVTEIAEQLYLSQNTVRTHLRHLYAKLGAHRRHTAVERARALGLLAPAARRP
jgi:LuxR family transcriptional regulator, maltose regulon positive regulatory protein